MVSVLRTLPRPASLWSAESRENETDGTVLKCLPSMSTSVIVVVALFIVYLLTPRLGHGSPRPLTSADSCNRCLRCTPSTSGKSGCGNCGNCGNPGEPHR